MASARSYTKCKQAARLLAARAVVTDTSPRVESIITPVYLRQVWGGHAFGFARLLREVVLLNDEQDREKH